MKNCTRCGEEKPYNEFYAQSVNSKDGYQSHCKSCDNQRKKAWIALNPEKVKKHAKTSEKNRLHKPERRAYRAELKKKPHVKASRNASYSKRRAAKINRTPSWLNDHDYKVIKGFYSVAQMLSRVNNEVWHVDHDIPLQAELVSGLHVPGNLVLMRGIENETKRNIYIIN
jgi:hypothetical protein